MKAYCLIRDQPWYRRSVFVSGLKAAGHTVELRPPMQPDKNTLLIIWNRYSNNHDLALQVERAGGKVIVAENGYVGRGGGTPKFEVHPAGPQPHHYYALALGFHNDESRTLQGDHDRFAALQLELKPWREDGEHILVCPNRSFGVPSRMMHPDWDDRAAQDLRKRFKRPVRIRKHPGNNAPKRSLAEDLKGAWACVVWSSSCGIHALAEGIPVVVAAPNWIMKSAGVKLEPMELPDRLPHFQKLAWAQWTCEEIERGEPFCHLLSSAR